ncbi:metallophosphoesterase [Paenibacillus pectinilyticus]|uniref:Metallophosphoesterase n=1 Tax=Paenibacillus pectinilyticus TaxID=512399 RepID=A0A1C0ZSJ5_9BACL|nr:lasso peptide biosynthesis PqqD family chaperone [Paenibacillus pectinilyticus]OCT11054.1 metallophosphoesterase [Paenibacillus pectinilyticus]
MIKQATLTIVDIVEQGKGNIVSNMGEDKVMLNVQHNKYYNLGEVGGRIWELIASPTVIAEIILTLISEYQVEKEQCEEHVIGFLEHLLKEELIYVREK